MIHKNHTLGPEGRRDTVPVAMGPEGHIADLEVQSFAHFQMGVSFEVITCCMVPSEIKCWYDDYI